MKNKRCNNILSLALILIMVLVVSNPILKLSAQESNYQNYFLSSEEEHNLYIEKIEDGEKVSSRTNQKTFSYTATAYLDDTPFFKYTVTITFTYGIPTTNGHIAQITSASAQIIDVYDYLPYNPDRNGIGITCTTGDPAIARITFPFYNKTTGAYAGYILDNVVCNATGTYN